MVGIPIDLIISDYTLSVEMKIIEGVAILSLNAVSYTHLTLPTKA